MYNSIIDNEIHGTNFYTAGRYNYTAIDCTHANGSGCETVITGIKPKKLAEEIKNKLEYTQKGSMESVLIALELGSSANSEELYLSTTNTAKIYDLWLKQSVSRLKILLDSKSADAREWQNLIRNLDGAFWQGVEDYRKEFPDDRRNFTALDVACCIHKWIQSYRSEYAANGLNGY